MIETITLEPSELIGLADRMRQAMIEGLNEGADAMVILAQTLCPTKTGALRDSIHKIPTANGVRVVAGGIEYINPRTLKSVLYASYVEARQPFMRPAYEAAKDLIEMLMRAKISEKVKL